MTDDVFFDAFRLIFLPAGEVDENSVYIVLTQDLHSVECTVGFAYGTQKFPGGGQVIFGAEVAVSTQFENVPQAVTDAVHTLIDEVVGNGLIQTDAFKGAVVFDHAVAGFRQFQFPIAVAGGEKPVDAGGTGLFIFQQKVGDPAVCGNYKNTVVKFRTGTLADKDVVHQLAEAAHGSTADFFYCVLIGHRY